MGGVLYLNRYNQENPITFDELNNLTGFKEQSNRALNGLFYELEEPILNLVPGIYPYQIIEDYFDKNSSKFGVKIEPREDIKKLISLCDVIQFTITNKNIPKEEKIHFNLFGLYQKT